MINKTQNVTEEDLLFQRWYDNRVVKFIGGPLHGEVMKVDELYPWMFVLDVEQLKIQDWNPKVTFSEVGGAIRRVKYTLTRESFVVYPIGWSWLYTYVFSEWTY